MLCSNLLCFSLTPEKPERAPSRTANNIAQLTAANKENAQLRKTVKYLKEQLHHRELKEKDTSSIPKLEAAVRDVWNNIQSTTLQNLVLSVPDRLQDVIARKGKITSY